MAVWDAPASASGLQPTLRALLAADPEVSGRLDESRLDDIFDPGSYLVHEDESFRRLGLLPVPAIPGSGSAGGQRGEP